MSEAVQYGGSGAKPSFAAFISYAHADAKIASKLQSKLERYRLPKHIAEAHAQGNAALGRIFRDREDLAAAPSLSEAIRDAISEAEALVVICSPDAKASRWVSEEIILFRQLHPDRPILAAIVRGKPEDAFPHALTEGGTEPLAADLRAEGDGDALGFLKIVAGIAGVSLDALVQRDAQRRLRRVMWITAGALAAMLVMGIMTTFAIQSRNEATRQRAAAEGLVEYMLTDLRDKLKGVGRFDVLDAVNARALEHYRRQGDFSELPNDSLERRARILHAMGEDFEKRDKLDLARQHFEKAHTVTHALLQREPKKPQRIFVHAQSEYWLGRIAERSANWPTAMRYYRAYADDAKQLITLEPDNPDYMMEMGWGHLNIGLVQIQAKSQPDFGEDDFRYAIGWMLKALNAKPKDPAIQSEIGNAYAWLADSLYLKRDFAGSLEARQRELTTKQMLAQTDRNNVSLRFDVAKAQYAVAASMVKLGNRAAAAPLLRDAAQTMDQLSAIESGNREWNLVGVNIREMINDGG
jgi:hypothetical protein